MSQTASILQTEFPSAVREIQDRLGEEMVVLDGRHLREIAAFLLREPSLHFQMLTDLTVVDRHPQKPRFEVVYHLLSLTHARRLRLKLALSEENPQVESLVSLWPGAEWLEREAWDMFGVTFQGHPGLQRILMYDEFEGHPLRKDYPYRRRQPLIGPLDR